MALIAVSCLIAVPLHHFVENAYRGRAISRRKVLLLLSATSLIVGLAVFAVFTGGWPQRLSQEQRQVLQTINQEAETYRRAYERKFPMPDETAFDPSIHAGLECSYDYAGDIDILVSCLSYNLSAAGGFLVIGDSNGGNTFQALRMAYKKTNFAFLQQSGCAAAAFRENPRSQNWCFRDVDQILDRLVSKKKIRGVILSSRWVEQPYEHVAETIEKIQALKAPVLLVGPTPMLRHNLFETIFMKRLKDLSNLQSLPLQDPYFSRDVLKVEAELKMTAKRYDIPYFSKVNFWCPKNVCTIFIAGMDAPLFLDTQHLTKSGLTYFAQQLRGELAVRDFIVSADN
ncbi:MAG: hypothetical protein L6Q57_02735 [Alphaproteobacteria bacterium]|nr:hypothetical protein [Alphaproteobacteria bacterium]